jgi:hypothetical protein
MKSYRQQGTQIIQLNITWAKLMLIDEGFQSKNKNKTVSPIIFVICHNLEYIK